LRTELSTAVEQLAEDGFSSTTYIMKKTGTRALFAVSSLGLGHATRSLAIIKTYLDNGWQITIVSAGSALKLLRNELAGHPCISFLEMTDYPPLERGLGWRMYFYLVIDLLETWRLIRNEHRRLREMEDTFDFIFSDGRYGFYSKTTPSFILTHQVAFIPPPFLKSTFLLTKYINLCALRKFDTILIPDYPSNTKNLSGILSHSSQLESHAHRYVGVLSSYRHLHLKQDIDFLFVISGYLFEHKETFVRTLLSQASTLPGKKVFILGQLDETELPGDICTDDDIIVYPMVDGEMRQILFNRSKMIIGRAGYTTIMDLVEHDKPGLLIPTPNQTEQEYLADHMKHWKYFGTALQDEYIQLQEVVAENEKITRFTPPWRTEESVARVKSCIDKMIYASFISIIVPAHNEESELEETVKKLLQLNYPADRYEIILVENGSDDSTLSIAQQFASCSGKAKVSVLQSRKGVSRAKNLGLAHTSPQSEWVVFCDADTHLEPQFLRHLNTRLNRSSDSLSVGTCRIMPRRPFRWGETVWFRVYDSIHQLTKTSYSLQIARTQIAVKVGFQPDLNLAEDLLFIKGCLHHGRFFFLPTDQVSTSTRRFNAVGYLRLSLFWMVGALLPVRWKQRLKYNVIR
jgi:hypothetical protein